MKNSTKFIIYTFLFIALFVLFLNFVSAADCWLYTTQTTCAGDSGCNWHADAWGGWCEQLGCWNYNTQTNCNNANIPGKNCTWSSSASWGWCEQTNCWSFAGTNESYCELTNPTGLNCTWTSKCSGYNANINCWALTDETNCEANTGCYWGECMEKGCWAYTTSSACNLGTGSKGQTCSWNSNYNYCYEKSCWDYSGTNQTACQNNAANINCTWVDNYYSQDSCMEPSCWLYDFTNQTACQTNQYGLDCNWDGQYCQMAGCWNYNTQANCNAETNCNWKTSISTGWCEEAQCWIWDGWKGYNASACENNTYNLNCQWQNWGAGVTDGWCYKNTNMTCSNLTTERECMDTFYCWWEYTDWNTVSLGGNCKDPVTDGLGNNFFVEDNVGCYVFDLNQTKCQNITGCIYSSNTCIVNTSHLNANVINTNGINCTMVNDSTLCNEIGALSSCCEWKGQSCVDNKMNKGCKEGVDNFLSEVGVSACEDVVMKSSDTDSAKNLCERLMQEGNLPCWWDNSTDKCKIKTDIFGNNTQSCDMVDNEKICNAAGCKWTIENYCDGNRSVPVGRCELKGNSERNCMKACYACDYKFDGSNHASLLDAKDYCYENPKCNFTTSSSAPNTFGYCKTKEEFKNEVASNCETNCGSCTYYGFSLSATEYDGNSKSFSTCNTPKCYCEQAYEFDNVKCKWVADTNKAEGGYCIDSNEKICSNSCDRCYTRTNCLTDGRSAYNATGSCEWSNSNSETEGTCTKSGETQEICWDATDNDGDNFIDCADSQCYSDTFCGFTSGDCFGWSTQALCDTNNCSWITDPWGSWCDFTGATCWKFDGNQTGCKGPARVINETLNISSARNFTNSINGTYYFQLANIENGWVNGSIFITNGSGVVIAVDNYTVDYTYSKINFTNSTFMALLGGKDNITNISYQYYPFNASCEWSTGAGSAWCEQDWSQGESCYALMTETTCNSGSGCSWSNDTWCQSNGEDSSWCTTQGGWCNPTLFAPKNCWMNDTNSSACALSPGCSWETNEWANCQIDWNSMPNCWSYSSATSCNAVTNCAWKTDSSITGGGWCGDKYSLCWNYPQSECLQHTTECYWSSWNTCEPSCYNQTLTQTQCNQENGCKWSGGWCMEDWTSGGTSCSAQSTSGGCAGVSGCKWKEPGWCDPKGFTGGSGNTGMGASAITGMECWKYDGNQSTCTNTTLINITCSWMSFPQPFCEPDFSTMCWQYDSNQSACGNETSCIWDTTGSKCLGVFDQCWSNLTLSTNQASCNDNAYCNWTTFGGGSGWCEASCFSKTTQATCGSGCKWIGGLCETPQSAGMFSGMEYGAPVPIAFDDCVETNIPESIDLCNVGIKDTGTALGFGSSVRSFRSAGACDGEIVGWTNNKPSQGSGNDSVKYFVYLDTDGSTTSNCKPTDSNSEGYEFMLKYTSIWNNTLNKVENTFTSYKCSSGQWVVTDLILSNMKSKMCNEINGPMITVEKSSLDKYPSLYSSQKDMRIYVTTANQTTNATVVSDSAGPGWMTPGAIDFNIFSFADMSVDTSKFEDILKKGYVAGEDCFTTEDDDLDGKTNCYDWDCQYAANCVGVGVNGAGYSDTSMPLIKGVKTEEYLDSALIMYDSNKPANGTLLFYFNDSSCNTLNDTIYDAGILSTDVRDYKLWHSGEIYNTTGVNYLNYTLSNGTTYYYKLKICDSNNKCALSGCTSFKTPALSRDCAYCDFVTTIQIPTDWYANYDLDEDGVYEHVQGKMCGPNAGMNTNYTTGRRAHIKLNNSNGGELIFYNVTLTQSGLTSTTRDINDAGDLLFYNNLKNSDGDTIGAIGMISATRDKIINNMHPEICQITVPKGTTTCDELWHCDDNGNNCINRASEATLITNSLTTCTWKIPYCEFSMWASGKPGTVGTSTSSTTSSATTGKAVINEPISEEELKQGYTKELANGEILNFIINSISHSITVKEILSDSVRIVIESIPQELIIKIGEERLVELDEDNYYDLKIKLEAIQENKAKFKLTYTQELISSEEEQIQEEEINIPGESSIIESSILEKIKSNKGLLIIIILVIVMIIIGTAFILKNKKYKY